MIRVTTFHRRRQEQERGAAAGMNHKEHVLGEMVIGMLRVDSVVCC